MLCAGFFGFPDFLKRFRRALRPLFFRQPQHLSGDGVRLIERNFFLLQRIAHNLRSASVDFHDPAHAVGGDSDRLRHLLAGVDSFHGGFCGILRKRLPAFIASGGRLIRPAFRLQLRLQPQRNPAKFPQIQIAAGFLRFQSPLFGFQHVGKLEYRHLIGKMVFPTHFQPVVPVNDAQVLVNDNGGIAAVFHNIRFQRGELFRRQRREQTLHVRQHNGRFLRAGIDDFRVFHFPVLLFLMMFCLSFFSGKRISDLLWFYPVTHNPVPWNRLRV